MCGAGALPLGSTRQKSDIGSCKFSVSRRALRSRAMRAVTVRDNQVVVEEHPDPVAQPGEILVRVRAAGINGADILQMRGRYPAPAGSPQDLPGLEFAGEVVECADGVQRFAQGDRVMAVVGGGGQ